MSLLLGLCGRSSPSAARLPSWPSRRYLSGPIARSFFGAGGDRRPPGNKLVVWGILGVNVAVFAKWNSIRSYSELHRMTEQWTTSVSNLVHRPWTLVTSAFSHQQPIHLLFNMLVFYSFAPPLLSLMGASRFVTFYCSGAVVASLAHIAYCFSTKRDSNSLGASGAINSMMVAFALHFPNSQFLIFGLVPVPALVWVAGLATYEIVFLGDQSTTDRAGHLGGLAFGAAYYFLRLRRLRRF